MFIEAEFLTRPSERTFSGPCADGEHALTIRSGAVRNRYQGRSLPYEPNYLNAIRLLLEDIKPTVIIELGALEGGLTAYVSNCLSGFEYDYTILAFDLAGNPSSRQPVEHSEFLAMDPCMPLPEIEARVTPPDIRDKPIVILHNVGEHLVEDMERLDVFLKSGDVVVTNATMNQADHDALMDWADGRYMVMSRLCDLFGQNNIQNPNGFLIKA